MSTILPERALADAYILPRLAWSSFQGNAQDEKYLVTLSDDVNGLYSQYYREEKTERKEVLEINERILRIANSKKVTVLSRAEYICLENGECTTISPTLEKYLYDYGHHTLAGAKAYSVVVDAVNWLSPVLSALDINEPDIQSSKALKSDNSY